MRIFLVLICSFALAFAVGGAQEENKSKKPAPKKKQAQSAQHAAAPRGGPQKTKGSQQVTTAGGGRPASAGAQKTKKAKGPQQVTTAGGRPTGAGTQKTKKAKGPQQVTTAGGRPVGAGTQKTKEKTKGSQQIAAQGGQTAGGAAHGQKIKKSKGSVTNAAAVQSSTKTFKAQHFNLPTKTPPTKVAAVNFQQSRHIQGSQNWQGSNYTVFRNYSSQWHDRNWWSGHYNRVVFVYGGWYAWNAGYWIPAWGYAPNAYYAYDGPIYGYNSLPPDQVIANVQSALQQQGYYRGEVDGLLGPLTRAAIADYQRANGLVETSAIDQPTLESLGMA
jgi:Putative peptidoglycan binding domain